MAGRVPNLQLRGGVYRLWVRVPDILRPVVGKQEMTRSLHTGDFREASRLAGLERVKVDAQRDALRMKPAGEPLPALTAPETLQRVSKSFADAPRIPSLIRGKTRPNRRATAKRFETSATRPIGRISDTSDWQKMAPVVFGEVKRLLSNSHLTSSEQAPEFLHHTSGHDPFPAAGLM